MEKVYLLLGKDGKRWERNVAISMWIAWQGIFITQSLDDVPLTSRQAPDNLSLELASIYIFFEVTSDR